jgi:tRNA threonylcarbamoyladenosine biosynthesis protein TsaB
LLKFGKRSSCRNNYREIHLQETLYFVGDCAESANRFDQRKYIFLDEVVYPSAKEMSFKLRKIQKNDTVDVAYFEPYY